jgi:hypothetical protein
MQNQNQTPNKSSKIEKLTNKFIFIMLFLEILMAATCTFGITIWQLFEGILFLKKQEVLLKIGIYCITIHTMILQF